MLLKNSLTFFKQQMITIFVYYHVCYMQFIDWKIIQVFLVSPLQKVLEMDPTDPEYMPLIRKYSAIYGRFDCKRHPGKPMSLHEVSSRDGSKSI